MENDRWSMIWLTLDHAFLRGPIEVACIIITSSDQTEAEVSLRRGTNSADSIMGTFKISGEDSEAFPFVKPVYFDNGLFVDVDANTTGVIIIYRFVKG